MRTVSSIFKQCLIVLIFASLACAGLAQAQSPDFRFKVLEKTGDAAPGIPGFTFWAPEPANINETGDVAFYATAFLTSTVWKDGIWFRDAAGNVSLLASRFDIAPGLSGVYFYDIGSGFLLNDAGQVVFGSSLTGASVNTSNDISHWLRNTDGTISLIAREGDAAPGWSGASFSSAFRFDLKDNGMIAFSNSALVTGDINQRPGLWVRDAAGNVSLAARYGDAAPCTSSTFSDIVSPELTNTGRLLFEGRAGSDLRHGVWLRDTSGSISCLAYEGNPAPGIAGAILGKLDTNSTPLMRKVVNGSGAMALFSIISGPDVTSANDHAVWLRSATGDFTLIAREGDPAPGTAAGITYAALLGTGSEATTGVPFLNNAGNVLFSASLTGPGVDSSNDKGFWLWNGAGAPTLIARKGDQVPGAPAGTVIGEFPAQFGTGPQMNEAGDVLLEVTLSGPGVDSTNDQCLVFWNGTSLDLLLREGDALYIGPGDTRVVTAFLKAGYPGLNSNDQIAITAGFGSSFALLLAAPNSIPASQDTSVTLSKNTAYIFSASDFPFTDADAGDSLQQVRITSLPSPGTLKLGGTPIAAGDVISRAALDAGNFTFTPDSNTIGVPYATFQFTVHDSTAYSSAPSTMTLNVINSLPDSSNNSITAEQNSAYSFQAADFPFSDPDAGDSLQQVRISSLPVPGTLKLGGTPIAAGDVISKAALDAGNFTFTPDSNTSGVPYTTFQFEVSDGTGYSASAYTMTVNVLNTPVCNPIACPDGVEVTPYAGVTVTFDTVTEAGQTTVTPGTVDSTNPDACPEEDNFLFLGHCYYIDTTAAYTNDVKICLTYDQAWVPPSSDESALKFKHMESGTWTDRTSSVDTVNNVICGTVSSFSWFAIAVDNVPPTFTLNPLMDALWPANNEMVKVATVTDVFDADDPSPEVDIQVTSNQSIHGDWDVHQTGDEWEVRVRAERSGSTDRIYTINVAVTDKSGNQATATHTVRVEHD